MSYVVKNNVESTVADNPLAQEGTADVAHANGERVATLITAGTASERSSGGARDRRDNDETPFQSISG